MTTWVGPDDRTATALADTEDEDLAGATIPGDRVCLIVARPRKGLRRPGSAWPTGDEVVADKQTDPVVRKRNRPVEASAELRVAA
jgi:hypothetical protein